VALLAALNLIPHRIDLDTRWGGARSSSDHDRRRHMRRHELLGRSASARAWPGLMATHRSLIVQEGTGQADGGAAVDLNATNFNTFLNTLPESFAVMKFFAHWSEPGEELDTLAPVLSLSRDVDEEAAGDLGRSKI
jgi:hypothetical protein